MTAVAQTAEAPLLPVGGEGRHSLAWWGVLCLIATEAALFAYLLFAFYYTRLQHGEAWSPEPHPSLSLALPNTFVLLLSSVAVWWGEQGLKRGRNRQNLIGLVVAILLGGAFASVQVLEWRAKAFSFTSGAYGSLYFTITGFHMAHVIVGLCMLATVLAWSAAGYFGPQRRTPLMVVSTYWHFVDAVWLAVFFTFYVTPYLW